jgi:hypothetical protein
MPRYFFHLDDGAPASSDEGVELTDVPAVRAMALRFLGQSLADRPDEFWSRGEWRLTVTDADRTTLFSVQILATDASPVQAEIVPKPAA